MGKFIWCVSMAVVLGLACVGVVFGSVFAELDYGVAVGNIIAWGGLASIIWVGLNLGKY